MEKFLKGVFNFFWILIVGISSVIYNAVVGVACMITIIGIPFGLQYFKFLPLVFAPAGKVVVTKFSKHPIMNTLWLIFGGFETYIIYQILAFLLTITIIGIPIANQLKKIAKFNIAPFGAEIIDENTYSKYEDTEHDMNLLTRRILANPDKIIETDNDGNTFTARNYLEKNKEKYYKAKKSISLNKIFVIILFIVMLIIVADDVLVIFGGANILTDNLYIVIILCIIMITISPIAHSIDNIRITKRMSKYLKEMILYFPDGSEQVSNLPLNKNMDIYLFESLGIR